VVSCEPKAVGTTDRDSHRTTSTEEPPYSSFGGTKPSWLKTVFLAIGAEDRQHVGFGEESAAH
jgi:hypothetical protein